MVKKAYMKTIEILLVVVLTTIFLVLIIPGRESLSRSKHSSYLINLEKNDDFRNFVTNNNACFNSTPANTATALIERYLPQEFDYTLCTGPKIESVPEKDVYIDLLVIVGNYTYTNFKTIRLYYWTE